MFFLCADRDEGDFVGHTDEDQATDNEICTIASAKVDSGSRESANSSGNNKSAGLLGLLVNYTNLFLCVINYT